MLSGLTRGVDLAGALAIAKHAGGAQQESLQQAIAELEIFEGGHPLPDARSLVAGEAALEFVSGLQPDDLLVCLISGGGSALMSAPVVGLEDLQALTYALLAGGARIEEINTLRRRLDRIKGGGLAKATRARVLSLILSDVVGDPLEAIASGPTAPDPTTKKDALAVLEKYILTASLSGGDARGAAARERSTGEALPLRSTQGDVRLFPELLAALEAAPEGPRHGDALFSRVQNVIVGSNRLALEGALGQARREGFQAVSLGSAWEGEARKVGRRLAHVLRVATNERERPFCLIAGGETTVTLRGGGHGGRNQELALAAAAPLAGLQDALLASLATDGEDGPTDAAGAVVSGDTRARALALGLDPESYLERNDSYTFFDGMGDLIRTGPTGTNVNDLVFLFGL